eukprot:Pgem_evm1s9605
MYKYKEHLGLTSLNDEENILMDKHQINTKLNEQQKRKRKLFKILKILIFGTLLLFLSGTGLLITASRSGLIGTFTIKYSLDHLNHWPDVGILWLGKSLKPPVSEAGLQRVYSKLVDDEYGYFGTQNA